MNSTSPEDRQFSLQLLHTHFYPHPYPHPLRLMRLDLQSPSDTSNENLLATACSFSAYAVKRHLRIKFVTSMIIPTFPIPTQYACLACF